MRFSEIGESPQIVGDEDWQLSDPRVNLAKARSLRAPGHEILASYRTADLIRLSGRFGGQIGLVNNQHGTLEYYVHYEVATFPMLRRSATQIKLWRKRTASIQGLASMVVDRHLLAEYDSVVSDSRQTSRGVEFWQVQLGGHYPSHVVGLMVGRTVEVYDPNEGEIDAWLARVDDWGRGGHYRQRRFFITNLGLPPGSLDAGAS